MKIKEESKYEKVINKEITRRKFMKLSGKSMAGLAVSASLLSAMGCTQEQVDNGNVMVWTAPEGLLVVNEAKCTGCQRCEINCTLVNDGEVSSYISRVKVTRNLMISHLGNGIHTDNWVYFPDTCRQCEDPWCGNACPVEAIYSDDRGVKIVDQEKCIGCGACVEACPWEMPTLNPETNKSSKCISCGACVEACPWEMPTLNPETNKSSKCISCGACVEGCITGALSIVEWDEVTQAMQETRK